MAIPSVDNGGFLPAGIHDATLQEVAQRFGEIHATQRRRELIVNRDGLEQGRNQLQRMEDAICRLMSESDQMHPSQLALQLEGPLDMVDRLRAEIDDFLGI